MVPIRVFIQPKRLKRSGAGVRADGDGLRGADLQTGGGERLHDPP